jgi:hypothetical protein
MVWSPLLGGLSFYPRRFKILVNLSSQALCCISTHFRRSVAVLFPFIGHRLLHEFWSAICQWHKFRGFFSTVLFCTADSRHLYLYQSDSCCMPDAWYQVVSSQSLLPRRADIHYEQKRAWQWSGLAGSARLGIISLVVNIQTASFWWSQPCSISGTTSSIRMPWRGLTKIIEGRGHSCPFRHCGWIRAPNSHVKDKARQTSLQEHHISTVCRC